MRLFFVSCLLFFGTLSVALANVSVTFPIAELGDCSDESTCFAYCEEPDHFDACMAFAAEKDLVEDAQIEKYEKTRDALKDVGGPGGCTSPTECETYCSDLEHIDTCLAFAEEHEVMQPEALAEAKKVKAAIDRGAQPPGGCNSKDTCESYCQEPSHMEECFTFAKEAGLLPEGEIEKAEQMMELMKNGETPGGCTNKETCENYCKDEAHREECMNFAVKTGGLTQEELDMMKQRVDTEIPPMDTEIPPMDTERPPMDPSQINPEMIEPFIDDALPEEVKEMMRQKREEYESETGEQIFEEFNLEQLNELENFEDMKEQFMIEQREGIEMWNEEQAREGIPGENNWQNVGEEGQPPERFEDDRGTFDGEPPAVNDWSRQGENPPSNENFGGTSTGDNVPSNQYFEGTPGGEMGGAEGTLQSNFLNLFQRATRNIKNLLVI